jgi:hypothetical protein
MNSTPWRSQNASYRAPRTLQPIQRGYEGLATLRAASFAG